MTSRGRLQTAGAGALRAHDTQLSVPALPARPGLRLVRPRPPHFILLSALLIVVAAALACAEERPARSLRPNVLIFLVDAARVDHFGTYGYLRDTTPNVDAFARSAMRYRNVIAEGSFTFASVSSLFSGQSPAQTGLLKARRLDAVLRLLPEIARDAGYRTRAYSENPFVTSAFGFDRGFDAFEAPLAHAEFQRASQDFEHADPTEALAQMQQFMREAADAPFFAYVHLLRPHNPYAPPEETKSRFGSRAAIDGTTRKLFSLDRANAPGSAAAARARKRKARAHEPGSLAARQLENIIALYDENLAAADAAFGVLFGGLDSRTRNETIVLVLSDHGEAFLEHDRLLHGSTVFDEMIRVPLLVRLPGNAVRGDEDPAADAPGGERQGILQLADVSLALRAVLEGEPGAVERLGQLGREDGSALSWAMLAEERVAIRTLQRKVVLDARTLAATAYYDLASDPGEQNALSIEPLDAEGERLVAIARERIRAGRLARKGEGEGEPGQSELDPALRERLRSLGYTEE